MKTIIRENRLVIGVLAGIGILLIAALLVVPATPARAETVKFKYTTQLTKFEYVPLPDVEGHLATVFERRGVAIFENEVAAISIWGTFDYLENQGPWEGYTQITFKDGSSLMYKIQGASSPDTNDTKLLVGKGKGEYIKGTGRFEGIKGQLSLNGRLLTPYTKDKTKGDNWVEVTGTYTLPKK